MSVPDKPAPSPNKPAPAPTASDEDDHQLKPDEQREPERPEPAPPTPNEVRPVPEEPAAMTCECGKRLPGDAKFCLDCGARVRDPQPRYVLSRIDPKGAMPAAEINGEDLIIGNSDECGVVVDGDDYVSRRHARVTHADGMFFVEDLGSSNGTFLRVRRAIILQVGDEILVGATTFRFEQVS